MPDTKLPQPQQANPVPAPYRARASDPSHVIVIDPDGGVRRVVALVLDEIKCKTVGVPDAESALEILDEEDPALILAEVRLPGMSGSELGEQLRDRNGFRPCFVLMSAYPRPPHGAEDYFLEKPLRFDRLLDITKAAITEKN